MTDSTQDKSELYGLAAQAQQKCDEAETLKIRVIEAYGEEIVPVRREIDEVLDFWTAKRDELNGKYAAYILGKAVGDMKAEMMSILKSEGKVK